MLTSGPLPHAPSIWGASPPALAQLVILELWFRVKVGVKIRVWVGVKVRV